MNFEKVCYGCFNEKENPGVCPHCGFDENEEQPYLALPLGTILNGRYMLGKVLGVGGFGITYLGYDLTLEITVAVKEYMPSSLVTRSADRYTVTLTGRVEDDYLYGMERFLDEAKILAKLHNTPNIVSVQNYFKENKTAYFVMEYVDGMSLKSYLKQHGEVIPYNQALTILQPIMEAMIQVHSMNLLHRDISPDNIYITSNGESRLLDFGAARFAMGDGKSVSVILKHGYAPEEQYSSHGNQGPWTDVYAMSATLYRCITGILPPDSIERIHKDTLKRPSELGISLPAHIEKAIIKALSVRAEDRFANMESFLRAVTGKNSVQEQITARINEKTQAAAYGTAKYDKPPVLGKTGRFSILSYFKSNPVIAGVSIGGLLVVIALCIVIPVLLSNGGRTTPSVSSGGNYSVNEPLEIPYTSVPSETSANIESTLPSEKIITQDLSILNATIDIPSDYESVNNGFAFINSSSGYIIETDFCWNIEGPIYSISDIEAMQEELVASVMNELEISDYRIIDAGSDIVGNRKAYQIYFEGTDSDGYSIELIFFGVEGYNSFGCYYLLGLYPKWDESGKNEIYSILRSFRSNGKVDTSYESWYGPKSGLQIIIDNSLAGGEVVDYWYQAEGNTVYELVIYPTQAAREAGVGNFNSSEAGNVETGYASQLGLYTPEEVIDYNYSICTGAGGTATERYSVNIGGEEWLCQDYSLASYNFSYSAAVIDGECILVGCMYNESNMDDVLLLYRQVLASVRPWEE